MVPADSTAPQHDDLQGNEQTQCIYSRTDHSRRCGIVITKHEYDWAQILRQTLEVCPPRSPTFRNILAEYSRTHLCYHHRRQIDVHHNEHWQNRLDQWTDDLRHQLEAKAAQQPLLQTRFHKSRDSESSQTTAQKLRPSTSAPTSPCRDHNISLANRLPALAVESHRRNKSDPVSDRIRNEMERAIPHVAIPCFQAYNVSTGRASSFQDVVTSSLTVAESMSGYIYAYRRITGDAQDQRYIRIGHSLQRLDDRVRLWSQQCQYFFELVCPSVRVRNAARVEALIHKELELALKRRCDVRCKQDSKRCQTTHDNWFEVDVTEAESVIQYWSSWMESHNPYDNNGNLQLDLLNSITEVRHVQNGSKSSLLLLNDFHHDSKGRLWHNIRQTLPSPSTSSTFVPDTPRSGRSRMSSKRNKPVIPQRRSSLSLGSGFSSPSIPQLPLTPDMSQDVTTPTAIVRRKTSNNLRASFDDHHNVPMPVHQPSRSRSLASFRSQISTTTIPSHTRYRSVDNTARSSSLPPRSKSLRRRNRNSSLRSLVSDSTSTLVVPSTSSTPAPQIMEATVVRREKGRSIYIGAPSIKKIEILQDLSRIRMERSSAFLSSAQVTQHT